MQKNHKLKKGEILVIDSIFDIGKSLTEIAENWQAITDSGADIQVTECAVLDTVNNQEVTGFLIPILLHIGRAHRQMMRARRAKGIKKAKAKGVKFGRKKIDLPDNFDLVKRRWLAGDITVKQAAIEANMKTSTFYARARE